MAGISTPWAGGSEPVWRGPLPLATPHAVTRWRERVSPRLTLSGAFAELRRFLLDSTVPAAPPQWVRAKPGAVYLVCPTEPDVCIPVRDGHTLTVLVSWMAWVTER
jgi:hypothetical protein